MKRYRMKGGRRHFNRRAGSHPLNGGGYVSRGGIRL